MLDTQLAIKTKKLQRQQIIFKQLTQVLIVILAIAFACISYMFLSSSSSTKQVGLMNKADSKKLVENINNRLQVERQLLGQLQALRMHNISRHRGEKPNEANLNKRTEMLNEEPKNTISNPIEIQVKRWEAQFPQANI